MGVFDLMYLNHNNNWVILESEKVYIFFSVFVHDEMGVFDLMCLHRLIIDLFF